MGLGRILLFLASVLPADAAPVAWPALARLPALPSVPRVLRAAPPRPGPSARLPASVQLAIEREIDRGIERGDFPGAVVIAGRRDGVFFRRAFGAASLEPARRAMTADAVFDLASVTKAVATASSIACLVEDGRLRYDDLVSRHLPAFQSEDKREITLRHLLTHTSGLPPVETLGWGGSDPSLRIAQEPLQARPGERHHYSDLGFIVLGDVVARVSGEPLDRFSGRRLFAPLGLADTGFRPGPGPRLVPTERDGDGFLLGKVHDPRARAQGGVAGHAGLFASADDLARFARMLLSGGALDGVRVLAETTVRVMTRPIDVSGARVALGWDVPDAPSGGAFSPRAFGHEGFTGTSFWVDPERDRFLVFLSSRLHPDGKGRSGPTAHAIRALVTRAELELEAPRVELGVDALASGAFDRLRGRRVAVLTHAAARNGHGKRTLDVLVEGGVDVVRVVSPEHGFSAAGEGPVADAREPRTGLPVVSLYGGSGGREAWARADLVLVDLVDVGARFYTYAAALLAALESGLPVLVLDRPNPSGGLRVAGPVSSSLPRSLVDPHPMPLTHGMTFGELGRFMAFERGLPRPDVMELAGWTRAATFRETGLAWFAPSPNLRSPDAALFYPGLALFEYTNLSVGRGTATPFELLGAPWLEPKRLLELVAVVPGASLGPEEFSPDAGPHRGERCRGIRFRVTDARALEPVGLAFALMRALRSVHASDWDSRGVRVLLGTDALGARDAVALEAFAARRKEHLLYR